MESEIERAGIRTAYKVRVRLYGDIYARHRGTWSTQSLL